MKSRPSSNAPTPLKSPRPGLPPIPSSSARTPERSNPPLAKRRRYSPSKSTAPVGGQERRERRVGGGAEHAVVGQLEAEAVDVGLLELRHQHPARALDPGLGDAEPRQVADRQPEDLDPRVLEIDAPRLGVLGDARGADRPGRRGVLGADGAGAGDGAVERGVAPAASGAPRRRRAAAGRRSAAARPRSAPRPGPASAPRRRRAARRPAGSVMVSGPSARISLGALVVDDARGAQHPALVEHLDVARRGQHARSRGRRRPRRRAASPAPAAPAAAGAAGASRSAAARAQAARAARRAGARGRSALSRPRGAGAARAPAGSPRPAGSRRRPGAGSGRARRAIRRSP